MKKTLAAGFGALLLLIVSCYVASPLRWPEPALRRWVLSKAPYGSSAAKVREAIQKNGWRYEGEWKTDQPGGDWGEVDGAYVVYAYLGHYQGIPWRVDVDAFWGFDERDRLVDINIRVMADSL